MLRTSKTFGSWQDLQQKTGGTISHNRMTLDAAQLSQHWRRCSLSSDFWARYTSLSSSLFQTGTPVKREAVESTISYLLNELFENCAKFSSGPDRGVVYESWVYLDRLSFQVTNHIESPRLDSFIHLIEEMLGQDPGELYFKRLEENAETNVSGSGLGYLTLMKDYQVKFGFRFTPLKEKNIAVDVQAHINVKEI